MKKELYEFIINELKAYKMNKSILENIHNECCLGISAQKLSDMPRSVTNKFSSITENQAFNNKAFMELNQDIRRVEIWLYYLNDEERHVIEGLYIHNRSYNTLSNSWKIYYSRDSWSKKKNIALNKIKDLIEMTIQKGFSS